MESKLGSAIRLLLVMAMLTASVPVPARAQGDPVQAFIAGLSTRDRVGQLFLVAFPGDTADRASTIAELIQRYRIGGVVLAPENGNVRNDLDAATRVRQLTQDLQALALERREDSLIDVPPNITEGGDRPAVRSTPTPAPVIPADAQTIPLLIGVQQDGDGYPYSAIRAGLTQLPSAMAIGATWKPDHAYAIGRTVGAELAALGVNMLLGPDLDVLQRTRPEAPGDIGVRSFGGDPFWVGQMGRAYIQGLHEGSAGMVLAISKHFPGLGSSDRRASEEVATVQKSLQELKQIELAPFISVTSPDLEDDSAVTDGMMTSPLIRYRGFQGNIRQLTRPIGLDSDGLSALMNLPEFAPWRVNGLLVSGPLGLPAVRRFYDPQGRTFPHKRIAQDALMAGNDLIYLCDFAIEADWELQVANMEETIVFFMEKYESEPSFRARVDASLERIIRAKMRLYPEFSRELMADLPELPDPAVGAAQAMQVAQDALTLIYPGAEELADRLPGPPLRDELMLVLSDTRTVSDCSACPPFESLPAGALEKAILRLYGPNGSGQVTAANVRGARFADLKELIAADATGKALTPSLAQLNVWLQAADWLVFLVRDVDATEAPDSDALKVFLKQRPDWMRNRKVIVFALNVPYYLDTTEVSKLTAYYALYSKTDAFLETAARALFREVPAYGSPPLDVEAVNYELIARLEPDPNRLIQIGIVAPAEIEGAQSVGVKVGSTVTVRTSTILDRNGNPVPDGTPVQFRLYYPAESLELPRRTVTTVGGEAETSIALERSGQLEVSASTNSGATSSTLVISIKGDEPAVIATILPPTSTPAPTATATPRPTETPVPPEAVVSPEASVTAEPRSRFPGLGAGSGGLLLAWGLAGMVGGDLLVNLALGRRVRSRPRRARLVLLSLAFGLAVYTAYLLGWLDAVGLPAWPRPLMAAMLAGVAAMVPGIGFVKGGSVPRRVGS